MSSVSDAIIASQNVTSSFCLPNFGLIQWTSMSINGVDHTLPRKTCWCSPWRKAMNIVTQRFCSKVAVFNALFPLLRASSIKRRKYRKNSAAFCCYNVALWFTHSFKSALLFATITVAALARTQTLDGRVHMCMRAKGQWKHVIILF